MLNHFSRWFSADLAVDLGTANTLIGVPGRGLVLNEPSVVAVGDQSRRVLSDGCAVGHLARQMLGRVPGSIQVVRPLREGVITDFALCEAMLRYFLQKAQTARWAWRPRTLIGAPGCITPVEKRALYHSALRAGARQVFLLPQIKATAVGAALPIHEPLASMICDIGAGATEAAVFCLSEAVAAQSVRVGGDSMDLALVDYLRRQHNLRVGTAAAERLRIEIGSAAPLPCELTHDINGVDALTGLPRRALVTSQQVREALAEPVTRILETIRRTLEACTPDLVTDLVDHGIALAGGGALLRGLDQRIAAELGLPARVVADPLLVGARGMLICLEQLDSLRSTVESSDDQQ